MVWFADAMVVHFACFSFLGGRSRILSDYSLRIENVQVADDGVYVCRVENQFGSREAEAKLTVHCKSFSKSQSENRLSGSEQCSGKMPDVKSGNEGFISHFSFILWGR